MSNSKKHNSKTSSAKIMNNTTTITCSQNITINLSPLPKGFCILKEKPIYWVIFLISNFITGIEILYISDTFIHFFPHLICLTINICITILIGKEYIDTILFLDKEIVMNHISENAELRIKYNQFRNKAFGKRKFIWCLIVLTIFLKAIFSQEYITIDLVGCYATFIVTVSVSISVIGYAEYLYLLWFLWCIRNCTDMHYNKNSPANTPFLVKIATLTNHAKWCFFGEGFLYVFEYYILIPKGKISFQGVYMPDNISFLITWCIVFIVIILAFPTIIIIQESLMSKIVNNLKNKQIEILSELYEEIIPSRASKATLQKNYIVSTLISNIVSSADYPVKTQKFGPALISIATFFLHAFSLLSQLPSLKYLF